MFKIVDNIKSKKIYHFFKEGGISSALFIFEDEDQFEICKKLVNFLKEKFKNVHISIQYLNPKKLSIFVNRIQLNKITRSYLSSNFDLVIIVPISNDEYDANIQFFGLPINVEKVNNNQNNLVEYYGLNQFVLININEVLIKTIYNIAEIIDNLYFKYNINCVLFGDSVSIAEICYISKSNPIAIYNNMFLVEQFKNKCSLFLDNFTEIEDIEQSILNYKKVGVKIER